MVAALARIRPVEVHRLTLSLRLGLARNFLRFLLNHSNMPPANGWLKLLYVMPELPQGRCDLIVSAGGKTSFANAWLAKRLGAKNIFAGSLRRLSPTLFDVVVTLEPLEPASPHNLVLDLPPSAIEAADLEGHGRALRRECGLGDEKLWTVMIGGDGAGYHYHDTDWQQLAQWLNELGKKHQRRWLLLGSRRTGREAERLLHNAVDSACVAAAYWYGEGDESRVEACLGAAERVFVTEDSMTMLTEAISSRRPVISLRPSAVASTRRYADMISRFEQQGWLKRYALKDPVAEPPNLDDLHDRIMETSPLDSLAQQLAKRLRLE